MKIQGVTLSGGIKLNTSAAPAPGPTPGPTLSNGYASGSAPPNITITYIQKFPFASDDNSTIIGDLVYSIDQAVGNSSATSGYTAGGDPSPTSPGSRMGTIQKFPFATDSDATNVGNLTTATSGSAGISSENDGYLGGGQTPQARISQIQKYSFANESSTSTLPANLLTGSTADAVGNSSSEDGYVSGGYSVSASPLDNITKFSFASFAGITSVGDLTQARTSGGSQNSSTHGYVTGGWLWPGSSVVIDKFSFSSNGNATDVGDLAIGTNGMCGQSSIDNGYSSGGYNAAAKAIQKFPFATDSNASNLAALTENASSAAGQQG